LDAEEAKIKSEIKNLLEKLSKKAVTIEMLRSKFWACLSFPIFIFITGGFVSLHTEPNISIVLIAAIFGSSR
jgi:hypothetical protein